VQAQPLYLSGLTIGGVSHNVVFVATQHDSVYAIDADTGVQYWQTSFLNIAGGVTTVPAQAEGCNNVTGFNELGIVGTPVIDHSTGTLYVTAKTGSCRGTLHLRVPSACIGCHHGPGEFGGPVQITGQIATLNFIPLIRFSGQDCCLRMALYLGFGSMAVT
jgi:outer membrane protein assembly factor BamB